jgi:nitrile hydratase subunit beta
MNGVHDMGGMHGFGPVEREENEPLFHASWEGRVRAMMSLTMAQGIFNLDAFRYGIEQMQPADYLRSTYFERWLATVEYNLIQNGVLTEAELDARTEHFQEYPAAEMPRGDPAWKAPNRLPEPEAPSLEPRYAVGDLVIVRNVHPTGHTRMPRYTRGKRGTIHLVHGPEIFPDTHAHGLGVHWQTVYNVCFDGHELWGESAEPGQTLYIDLWESYLEPCPV